MEGRERAPIVLVSIATFLGVAVALASFAFGVRAGVAVSGFVITVFGVRCLLGTRLIVGSIKQPRRTIEGHPVLVLGLVLMVAGVVIMRFLSEWANL
jgi:hypothetical protein